MGVSGAEALSEGADGQQGDKEADPQRVKMRSHGVDVGFGSTALLLQGRQCTTWVTGWRAAWHARSYFIAHGRAQP